MFYSHCFILESPSCIERVRTDTFGTNEVVQEESLQIQKKCVKTTEFTDIVEEKGNIIILQLFTIIPEKSPSPIPIGMLLCSTFLF